MSNAVSNSSKEIIEELKRYGYVRRGYIGITTENAQKEIFFCAFCVKRPGEISGLLL